MNTEAHLKRAREALIDNRDQFAAILHLIDAIRSLSDLRRGDHVAQVVKKEVLVQEARKRIEEDMSYGPRMGI